MVHHWFDYMRPRETYVNPCISTSNPKILVDRVPAVKEHKIIDGSVGKCVKDRKGKCVKGRYGRLRGVNLTTVHYKNVHLNPPKTIMQTEVMLGRKRKQPVLSSQPHD